MHKLRRDDDYDAYAMGMTIAMSMTIMKRVKGMKCVKGMIREFKV